MFVLCPQHTKQRIDGVCVCVCVCACVRACCVCVCLLILSLSLFLSLSCWLAVSVHTLTHHQHVAKGGSLLLGLPGALPSEGACVLA